MTKTVNGPDGKPRCFWCGDIAEFFPYHDHEWGYPTADDNELFERISLEGFQSGLSWRTILAKRDNFRKAFKNFDFKKVARFTDKHVEALLQDAGIVRHRGKIEAVINNAQCLQELIKTEGSLANFIWRFEPNEKSLAPPQSVTICPEAVALSKALKKRGWKFVGPTTVYSTMQAIGMVNDHVHECVIRKNVERARKRFKRPL